jgi:hypothetical protein
MELIVIVFSPFWGFTLGAAGLNLLLVLLA